MVAALSWVERQDTGKKRVKASASLKFPEKLRLRIPRGSFARWHRTGFRLGAARACG
jgi:hypothetical protein